MKPEVEKQELELFKQGQFVIEDEEKEDASAPSADRPVPPEVLEVWFQICLERYKENLLSCFFSLHLQMYQVAMQILHLRFSTRVRLQMFILGLVRWWIMRSLWNSKALKMQKVSLEYYLICAVSRQLKLCCREKYTSQYVKFFGTSGFELSENASNWICELQQASNVKDISKWSTS